MKTFILLTLGTFLCSAALCVGAQTRGSVTISGKLTNFGSQVIVEDLSDMQYLLAPDPAKVFVPSADGSFKITLAIAGPNYYRIGRNILYLTPGDSLVANLDHNAAQNGVFSGRGSAANQYLTHTPFPKAGSYMNSGRNAKPTAKETVDFILAEAASRKKKLGELKGVSVEFRRLENARIRADTINSLRGGRIPVYRPRLSADELKVYEAEYLSLSDAAIEQINKAFVDFSLMKLVVYRDIAKDLVPSKVQLADAEKIKDWIKASALIKSIAKVSDKTELRKFAPEIQSLKVPQYRTALQDQLDGMLKFANGDIAVNFTAQDLSGNPVNLEALKGKVIYLDLWATWCGPCVFEMPYFEKLKQKYKDDDNIAFVSLSIDDDIGLWRKSVSTRKADGLQWLISRNSLLDYNVVTVPRTIIIDKSFKIANLNAPVPSAKETERIISDLLR